MLFFLSLELAGWSSVILSVCVNWPFNVQMTEGSRKKQDTDKLPISCISLSYLSPIYRALHIAISLARTYLDKHIQGECRWCHNMSEERNTLRTSLPIESITEKFCRSCCLVVSHLHSYLMLLITYVQMCTCNFNLRWRRRWRLFVSYSPLENVFLFVEL